MVKQNGMTDNIEVNSEENESEGISIRQMSDEELAQKAQAGSTRCFDTLVFRYSVRLFQFLRKRLPTDQDTEDIVQDTFIKAFQNIHRYDHIWKFSTWIYTIASRLAVSHYRTKNWKLTNLTQAEMPDTPSNSKTPDMVMSENEDFNNLWNVARTLKPQLYEVLWLRYAEELSIKEIAAVMEKPQISVRVMLHRARLKLTDRFDNPAFLEKLENDDAASTSTPPAASVPSTASRSISLKLSLNHV